MDLTLNEVMMLLGEKDILIYQLNKQLAALQALVQGLTKAEPATK